MGSVVIIPMIQVTVSHFCYSAAKTNQLPIYTGIAGIGLLVEIRSSTSSRIGVLNMGLKFQKRFLPLCFPSRRIFFKISYTHNSSRKTRAA